MQYRGASEVIAYKGPEEDKVPGSGAAGGCKPFGMSAGNNTWVLLKGSTYS